MKIVVTGALGHIGSRWIRQVPRLFPKAHIVMVDNLATQRYGSLVGLPAAGRYTFHEADIVTAPLAPIVTGAQVVVHLAAMTDPQDSFRRPDLVDQVNVLGTRRVAAASLAAGAPLLFVSTTSVYPPAEGLADESCPSERLRPPTPYARSKLRAEDQLRRLGRHGLRFTVCRFGTVFGVSPGMRFHTAVNKFCWQASLGQPLSVWNGTLAQRRPYLEMGDAVRALAFLIRQGRFEGQVYNVATVHATVRDVIGTIRQWAPALSVEQVPARGVEAGSLEVSTARLIQHGFRYHGTLRGGIRQLLRRFRGLAP